MRCRMEIRWQSGGHSSQAWQMGSRPVLQMQTNPQMINPNQTIIFKYGSISVSLIGKLMKLKDLMIQMLKK